MADALRSAWTLTKITVVIGAVVFVWPWKLQRDAKRPPAERTTEGLEA